MYVRTSVMLGVASSVANDVIMRIALSLPVPVGDTAIGDKARPQ